MPLVNGKYQAPNWKNGQAPAIDAAELQAICDTLAKALLSDNGNLLLTGNLTLKGSGNFGNKINLGDGDYVHISEPTDDCLEIKAKKLNFVLSDTSENRLTINGKPFNTLRTERGSYVGTGTYGSSNKTRLRFSFQPTLVFLTGSSSLCFLPSGASLYFGELHTIGAVSGDNEISFYSDSAGAQCNSAGVSYVWIALE